MENRQQKILDSLCVKKRGHSEIEKDSKNETVALTRKHLAYIRAAWMNSTQEEPFQFTAPLLDEADCTIEDFAIKLTRRKLAGTR